MYMSREFHTDCCYGHYIVSRCTFSVNNNEVELFKQHGDVPTSSMNFYHDGTFVSRSRLTR
jgi:hypothetical protein